MAEKANDASLGNKREATYFDSILPHHNWPGTYSEISSNIAPSIIFGSTDGRNDHTTDEETPLYGDARTLRKTQKN